MDLLCDQILTLSNVVANVDSNYEGDLDNRKSIAGYDPNWVEH